MAGTRIAVTIHPAPDIRATAELARSYEAAGVDVLVTGEAYGLDAVSTLGYLAAVTERVELAAHILPICSRAPALTAMTPPGSTTSAVAGSCSAWAPAGRR